MIKYVILFFVLFVFFGLGIAIDAGTGIGIGAGLLISGLLLGGIFVICFRYLLKEYDKKEAQKKRQFEEALENNTWKFPVEKFYEKYTAKIGEIDSSEVSEATYQRAKIIAEEILGECKIPQQYFERYTSRNSVKLYFSKIWEHKQEEAKKASEEKLAQLRMEEKALEKKYTRYAEAIGLEKLQAICRDKCAEEEAFIASSEQKSNAIHQGAETTYNLNKANESSWALHGGIASGIAGGAAGLAVAADVQRKNANVQQQNRQLAQSIAALEIAASSKAWEAQAIAKKNLKQWQKKAEISKILLTDFIDEDQLLSMLKPQVVSLRQSETGAVALKVEIHTPSDFYIYENVEAVIDGSIAVFLKKGEKIVGSTFCVAGFGGYTLNFKYPRRYDCICTNVSEIADKYEVSFAPHHLWAVEKKDFDKLCCDDK